MLLLSLLLLLLLLEVLLYCCCFCSCCCSCRCPCCHFCCCAVDACSCWYCCCCYCCCCCCCYFYCCYSFCFWCCSSCFFRSGNWAAVSLPFSTPQGPSSSSLCLEDDPPRLPPHPAKRQHLDLEYLNQRSKECFRKKRREEGAPLPCLREQAQTYLSVWDKYVSKCIEGQYSNKKANYQILQLTTFIVDLNHVINCLIFLYEKLYILPFF